MIATRNILFCILAGLCAACGDPRPPAVGGNGEQRAQELVNLFKQAANIVFRVYIIYEPPETEHRSFSVTAWAPEDGRIRIRMTKLGVDFLEGLITADGTFTGVLVRDDKLVKSNVDELMPRIQEKAGEQLNENIENGEQERKGAPLLAALNLLRNEVRHGPINIRQDGYQLNIDGGRETLSFKLPHGLRAEVLLGNSNREPVKQKIIYNKKDKELFRLDYANLKSFERMQRMSKIQLRVPGDKGRYTIIMRKLDAVRSISAENLHLDVPDYPEISIEDFGKKVAE